MELKKYNLSSDELILEYYKQYYKHAYLKNLIKNPQAFLIHITTHQTFHLRYLYSNNFVTVPFYGLTYERVYDDFYGDIEEHNDIDKYII